MAIYKKVGKTGKVSYQVFWYDPDGKQHAKCYDKKRDAEAHEGKVKASKKENRYHDVFDVKKESTTTFNELADEYVKHFGDQKSFKDFKSHVIRELRSRFGEKKLSQITYKDLMDWRKHRLDTPTKGGKPRKEGSVNSDLAIFGHMLSVAVEWGWLETSPFKKGKRLMFKVDDARTQYLKEDEIVALLTECPPHLKPIVETAILTGMRRGELLGLKWEQIKNRVIHLDGSMCKSGKGRQIPVCDRLNEVFKELRRKIQLKSPYVFCDSQGRRYQEVKGSFDRACKRAGITNFRFHDLRHTFASRLVMRGASLKAVQELLGHADLSMTMRYSHLSQEHLKDSVNLLNDTPDINKTLRCPSKSKKADHPKTANLL